MAYSYANWASQGTPAARLARLNLHIDEVSAQMGPDVASLGHSRSLGSLVQYHATLMQRQKELQMAVGGIAGGVSLTSFNETEASSS